MRSKKEKRKNTPFTGRVIALVVLNDAHVVVVPLPVLPASPIVPSSNGYNLGDEVLCTLSQSLLLPSPSPSCSPESSEKEKKDHARY